MITPLLRATAAAALAVLPLTALSTAPAHAAAAPAPRAAVTMPLGQAIASLPRAAESRDGYTRSSFKHWVDADRDGCNTRAEVLIAEAIEPPTVGPRCALSGGVWWSMYDEQQVTAASALDVDHMVPLAEAWDSGASGWTAARRQAYANDLDAERSLIAVTAKTNRSKADQDPAEWMPPAAAQHCAYLADWTATKARWQLTVDDAERQALATAAARCPGATVAYEPAP
ncbi:HNH endonuclease family protein [Streptomyces lavendulocolor]|uniref:HNH endonuclease family protein n=1 Tax=Streptomyces lavendulocolor TaxID=67316 RepID=UPI003C2AEA41